MIKTKLNQRFLGWRMVAIAFCTQNFAIGATFGIYGVLVKPVAEEFGAPRSLASMGIAIIILFKGLCSPALGMMLDRKSIKHIMLLGLVLMAAGFAISSTTSSIILFLAAFGLVVGFGSTLLGTLPSTSLVHNWFVDRRGMAIGLMSIPVIVAAAPPLLTAAIEVFQWRQSLIGLAIGSLILVPVILMIVNQPREIDQSPYRLPTTDTPSISAANETTHWTAKKMLKSLPFWFLNLFAGMVFAGAIVIVTHIYSFATDAGYSAQQGAGLMSVNGFSAMFGAFIFGWVADRLSPSISFGLVALLQCLCWVLVLTAGSYSILVLATIGIGLTTGGAFPPFSALVAEKYGSGSFGTAMGLTTFLMLPLTFFAAPLAGLLYDSFGNYTIAFQIHIALFVLASCYFLIPAFTKPR